MMALRRTLTRPALLAMATVLVFSGSAPAQQRSSADRVAHARPPVSGENGRVMSLVQRIESTLTWSRYVHSTRVDERAGRYEFDCSGMTAWILARTAPSAHRSVLSRSSGRPLARDYYQQIAASPVQRASRGWQRVGRVTDAQAGDVIAWIRPRIVQSQNTGHVAIVVGAPVPVDGIANGYLLRIADASSYRHQDDSREGTGRTGFGYGTILVIADEATGAPKAYGWFGQLSQWVLETQIAIGRPVG